MSLQLGDLMVMATQAVATALVALQSSSPKVRRAQKSPKAAKQPLLAKLPADIGFMGDLVPDAVSTSSVSSTWKCHSGRALSIKVSCPIVI